MNLNKVPKALHFCQICGFKFVSSLIFENLHSLKKGKEGKKTKKKKIIKIKANEKKKKKKKELRWGEKEEP